MRQARRLSKVEVRWICVSICADMRLYLLAYVMVWRMPWLHSHTVSLKISVGRRPWTSRNFLLQHADIEASKDWCELFKDPSYRSHSFLDLKGPKGRL